MTESVNQGYTAPNIECDSDAPILNLRGSKKEQRVTTYTTNLDISLILLYCTYLCRLSLVHGVRWEQRAMDYVIYAMLYVCRDTQLFGLLM
jgi:hypothetical protein